ncbi:2-amino-4-hydroxy-6-hydroxymethyldihydropteridine diphosphokinase [Pedobacter sp. Du54]|uniref:2-amino-4-hydroxy-6- hydroxymethyldihydropteridine diphosphokinase n=1 Tax=Pedobacter anseongensis TaxID=3133439 RepID=UPI0030AD63DE
MQSDKHTAYLLLGSNLGKREKCIADAVDLLAERVGEIVKISSIYETAAWGKTDQPSFLNIAIEIETVLNPFQLLEMALKIEADLGRIRYEKWGSRLIDIDIILYGDRIIEAEKLKIPHPEMQHRKFVLLPLAEIAPTLIHPVLKQSISELLLNLDDNLAVLKR